MIKDLIKYVDTPYALIFQYDGFILNHDAWDDQFLDYDYIGGPWAHLGSLEVGNGGFSLRSRRLIDWLATNWREIGVPIDPEDVFISHFARPRLEQNGMTFAPTSVASRFSKEGNERSVVWNGEFGFHGITYTDISRWLDNRPEYQKQLTYPLNDFVTLMKKYPIYDGTVHVFKFKKDDMKNYQHLSTRKKEYEARITKGGYHDYSKIQPGHTIVAKRSGVPFKTMPVPAFERTVTKIERFNSLPELRMVYPDLQVTPPWKEITRWKRKFVQFLGYRLYPKDVPYIVFWFK